MSFCVNPHNPPKQIQLAKLKAWPVTTEADKQHWNRLVEQHHHLHDARLCGSQIRYVVTYGDMALVLLSFSSASYHLIDRDLWIGWNQEQREGRLPLIVQNSRFLILPGKKTMNLASRSMALCLDRLGTDWKEQYGLAPLAVETFTEKKFPGTSYKADNWERIGITRGFSRDTVKFYRENKAPKTIWVKELVPDARKILSAPNLPEELACFELPPSLFRKAQTLKCSQLESLCDVLRALTDSRRPAGRRFSLAGCLSIIALGFLVGCEGLKECAEVGSRLSKAQLKAIGIFPCARSNRHTAPSHVTLWRVMSLVDTIEFERHIGVWFNANMKTLPAGVALDGKTLCGSVDCNRHEQHVVSMVSHDMENTPFFFKRQQTAKGTKGKPPEILF